MNSARLLPIPTGWLRCSRVGLEAAGVRASMVQCVAEADDPVFVGLG